MTTIIGIKTNIGDEAVILASDTQMNYFDEDDNVIAKRPLLKIIHGDFWALACSGGDTDELRSFYNKLRNPNDKRYKNFGSDKLEEMMMKSLHKKRFYQINELNANYMLEESDIDSTHEFLMAVNKPNVDIFHIDIFGNLKKPKGRNYISLGSGKEEVEKYIEESIEGGTFDSYNINLENAIRLSTGAIKKSRYDILSGGPMDLVVIKKNSIKSFGNQIKESIENAEKKVLEEIIERVKSD
ncbi:MAG TPA: hypothetical protein QGG70_03200 [Candidatus Pacearchaeota archaeon]|jgi:hypothetical protein|nr:hypothetical protein [Candidatus Pacearchaeota archaeon]